MQSGVPLLLAIVNNDEGYEMYLLYNYSFNCSDVFYALFWYGHISHTHCEGINQVTEDFSKRYYKILILWLKLIRLIT